MWDGLSVPHFPDHELVVGDTWTDERTEEGRDGPISVRETHTVTGTDEIAGHDVLVIESRSEIEAFEIDLSHFFRAMFGGFAEVGEEPYRSTDRTSFPAAQEMLDRIALRISVRSSTGTSTTWFDPVEGIVRESAQVHETSMSMEFAAPDEETGDHRLHDGHDDRPARDVHPRGSEPRATDSPGLFHYPHSGK